jgi:hypothetical protein
VRAVGRGAHQGAEEPDVIGLQEVGGDRCPAEIANVAGAFGYSVVFQARRRDPKRGGAALLVKRELRPRQLAWSDANAKHAVA